MGQRHERLTGKPSKAEAPAGPDGTKFVCFGHAGGKGYPIFRLPKKGSHHGTFIDHYCFDPPGIVITGANPTPAVADKLAAMLMDLVRQGVGRRQAREAK